LILKGLKTILKIILIKQWKSEMNSYPLTLEKKIFEPTLLSGRDWANRVKVRRDKGGVYFKYTTP